MMKTPNRLLHAGAALLAWLSLSCLGLCQNSQAGPGNNTQNNLDVRVWNAQIAGNPLTIAVNSICSARVFTYQTQESDSKMGSGNPGDPAMETGTLGSLVEGVLSGSSAAKPKSYTYTILNITLLSHDTIVFYNRSEKGSSSDTSSTTTSAEDALVQFLRDHTKDDLIRVWRETGAKDAESAALNFLAHTQKQTQGSSGKIGTGTVNPWIQLSSASAVHDVYDSLVGIWLGGTPPVHFRIE